MDINIKDYLSDSEIKEIVSDELRGQIRKLFGSEREAQRLLSNLSYQIVFDEVEKFIPSVKDVIVNKTTDILKRDMSYSVFHNDTYGGKKSLAYQIMEQCVRDNKDVINEKVKNTIINKDYSEEIWNTFESLGETFMSNIYEITRLGREKSNILNK